jgi:hypothetical protein
MHRILVGCGAATLLLALPASVGSAPPRDFTTGGGQTALLTHFGYSAHQRPNGGASGHATFKNRMENTERKGHVVCIVAVGNRAFFTIRNQKQADVPGGLESFVVEDNGNPQGGQPPDEIRESTPADPSCDPARTLEDPGFVLTRGNINVTDAG